MLTERITTLFVSIFYFQKCQTRDYTKRNEFMLFLFRGLLIKINQRGINCEA